MSDYVITVEDHPALHDVQAVRAGLQAYNLAHVGTTRFTELGIFVRDGGTVVGGVFGEISWGWLYVDLLWMHESQRRQGYGRRLMATMEQAAVERGIFNVYLATTSFQALPFYQKLGYEIWGTLEDRPPGCRYYYLKKQNIERQPHDHRFVVEEYPAEADVYALRQGLTEHAVAAVGPTGSRDLGVFVRDPGGALRGGFYGRTYWGWFDLMFVWVDERLRVQGYGARLLALAEQECLTRGVRHIVADTTGFQALPFYQKHGFRVFGTLENRPPPGHTSYFVRKDL